MAQSRNKLNVQVRTPYQNYFSGTATTISANNRLGRFDVLPDHAPLFCLLKGGLVTVVTDEETLQFKANNGVMMTKNNLVKVFLNI